MPNARHIGASQLKNILDGKKLLTTRTASVTVDGTEYIYIGTADPGTAESASQWLIQRTALYADQRTATLFANGRVAFDQTWDDRETLTYG